MLKSLFPTKVRKIKVFLSLLVIILTSLWSHGYLYRGVIQGKPEIYWCTEDERMTSILPSCRTLKRKYIPTFWASTAYSQLLLLVIYQSLNRTRVEFDKHLLQTDDNGEVRCDVLKEPKGLNTLSETSPICLFLHVSNITET